MDANENFVERANRLIRKHEKTEAELEQVKVLLTQRTYELEVLKS